MLIFENTFLGTCKIYQEGDSMMKRLARQQLQCFYSKHYDCKYKCITNRFRGVFDMYPNTTLQKCKTEPDSICNFDAMTLCYFSKNVTKNCLDPCNVEIYTGNSWLLGRMSNKQNMTFLVKYQSMAVEVSEEYLVYDFANFIGTLGGSLGLFIGFSYTGFIGSIIDFLFDKFQIQ